MSRVRMLLRCDGTSEVLHGPLRAEEICRLIGAKYLDVVTLHHMGLPLHVMIVDDLGYDAGKPVNAQATALYHLNCKPGTTYEILGDAVVVLDEDFT